MKADFTREFIQLSKDKEFFFEISIYLKKRVILTLGRANEIVKWVVDSKKTHF